jgi:hypothetical protein
MWKITVVNFNSRVGHVPNFVNFSKFVIFWYKSQTFAKFCQNCIITTYDISRTEPKKSEIFMSILPGRWGDGGFAPSLRATPAVVVAAAAAAVAAAAAAVAAVAVAAAAAELTHSLFGYLSSKWRNP